MASGNYHQQQYHTTSESGGEHDVTPPEDRVCGFCNGGHAEGLEAAVDFIDIPTRTNIWADRPIRHGKSKRLVWCHTNCVHFSPLTKYDEENMTWSNMLSEYQRARSLTCRICEGKGVPQRERKGASIGCSVRECQVSVHFPCAIRERLPDGRKNWYPCQESTIPFFCLGHSAERAEYERSKEVARLADLTQGKEDREPFHDKAPYAVPADIGLAFRKFSSVLAAPGTAANGRGHGGGVGGAGGVAFDVASVAQQWGQLFPEFPLPRGLLTFPKSTDFTYVADTVDSKSAQIRQGPERGKLCCSCTGPASCRDPRTCECLRQGRQYSNKGRLLDEGHPPQVYECNLNCSCHQDECRNRLVQRGMTCSIKVMYLGIKASSVREGCGKWGVVAVEEIPARSFVCTVAGQLVLARDLDGSLDDRGQHSTSVLVHRVRDWTEWRGRRIGGGGGRRGGGGAGAGGGPSRTLPGVPQLAGGPQERFLDQRRYANISRYIRCAKSEKDVNLVRVAVHTQHQDPDAPVLALFAVKTIREGTELLRILADPTITGVHGGKGGAPRVGLYGLQACTASATDDACMQNTDMVEALDADKYLFVTGFEKGVLKCDSLKLAEDAPVLRFNLTNSEEVTATKKSFQITPGNAFSNKARRMVWTGEVVETGRVFGGISRSIAMSWSSGCDVETFMLKVTTPQHDGTTRAVVTLPCSDASEPNQVCLLQVDHAAEAESLETLVVDGKEEGQENAGQEEAARGVTYRSGLDLPSRGGNLDHEDRDADGNSNRRRYLRKRSDGDNGISISNNSKMNKENTRRRRGRRGRRPHREGSTTSLAAARSSGAAIEGQRRLEREVSEGMEAARLRNPDVDAKDQDLRLLSEYLAASPPEREEFHERGVRRLTSEETEMPSGRVLTSSTTIDVMVLYTRAAMVSSGTDTLLTEAQMETEIITHFATANDALADSGIDAVLNLVHVQQASRVSLVPGVDFKESTDMKTDLSTITMSTPEFDSLRSTYGADLVQLIGYYDESCGSGYVMKNPTAKFEDYGYSIVHVHCLLNLSHIHEIGHNLGANHDIESSTDIHDYAHAERHCSGDNPYRTVMAYDTSCVAAPRVALFSSPEITYLGKAAGSGSTDNARKIKEGLPCTSPLTSLSCGGNWHQAVFSVDAAEKGDASGEDEP
eukprot:g9837.t1